MKMRITAIENDSIRSLLADFDLVYKNRIIGRITSLGIKLEGDRLLADQGLQNTQQAIYS